MNRTLIRGAPAAAIHVKVDTASSAAPEPDDLVSRNSFFLLTVQTSILAVDKRARRPGQNDDLRTFCNPKRRKGCTEATGIEIHRADTRCSHEKRFPDLLLKKGNIAVR